MGRLPLGTIHLDLEGKNLVQIIKIILGIFDWKNATLFKKIVFPDLEKGTYVVKIFKENPFFVKERQYIGYAIVQVYEKTTVHINCRIQGIIELSIVDQNKKGVENAQFLLTVDDVIVADFFSDKNGSAFLKAPCYPSKPYTLKIIYKGFLIEEKRVTLGLKNRFISLKELFSIKHYELRFKLKDFWGFAPAIDVNPKLISNEMIYPIYISAEKTGDGEYLIKGIYPAKYTLSMSYKSFDVEKDVSVDKDSSLTFEFPAEYILDFNVMNFYGNQLSEGEISISRNRKIQRIEIGKNGKAITLLTQRDYENFDRVLRNNNVDVPRKETPNVKKLFIPYMKKNFRGNRFRRRSNNLYKRSYSK